MARPVVITKALVAADDDGIATTQTPLAAGNLTLDGAKASGGVATLDTQRRVIITSAGNDAAKTFTVYGTNGDGNLIQESIAGGNVAASATTLDFKTVTRIAVSAATAGAVIAGTNGVGSTPWVSVTAHIPTVELTSACEVTGTINYSVEYTYQDVNYSPTSTFAYVRDNVVPVAWADGLVQAQTVSRVAVLTAPVWGVRTTVNSGTGSVKSTYTQAGIAGP